ncbi:zinc finger MYND domain-containing protein 12 isoform X3 [Hippoglossus hippoglossus]|uniref:zinc finger MYND domain-containing protein 12 isoform X3 n=1 Tax=Hippoglossus hippoglossus TaxID=8267 RepID=UPI00148C8B02|nr:zinc finger MYND domain-containing protein 12 isoform X3 [Hippoglossus hippoglossus]
MDEQPRVSQILPLALPRGEDKLCELCQERAHLQCDKCRFTFYCNAEHQQADWMGIHQRICQLLVPIRNPTIFSLQRAGQIETQLKKAELIEICRLVARRKLSERKHQEAVPAAQFCLRCSIDVLGPSTVQLVPSHLLLAEANMGLGNLSLVAELLSQAEWLVLKSPDCGHAVRQQLHRSLGHLHTATGDLQAALLNFANDVAHIWHRHLSKLLKSHIQSVQNPDVMSEPSYDQGRQAEVDEMLRTMLEFEQDDTRKDPAQVALVAHCLAMLWFLKGDNLKALGFGSVALQASQLIPNHDLTEAVQGLLQLVQSLQTEPHPGSGLSAQPSPEDVLRDQDSPSFQP